MSILKEKNWLRKKKINSFDSLPCIYIQYVRIWHFTRAYLPVRRRTSNTVGDEITHMHTRYGEANASADNLQSLKNSSKPGNNKSSEIIG